MAEEIPVKTATRVVTVDTGNEDVDQTAQIRRSAMKDYFKIAKAEE